MLNQLAPRWTSCLMMFREVWLRIGFDVQNGCEELPFRLYIGTPLVLRRRRECMPRTPLSIICFMFRAICIPRRWPASSRSCFLAYLCGVAGYLEILLRPDSGTTRFVSTGRDLCYSAVFPG